MLISKINLRPFFIGFLMTFSIYSVGQTYNPSACCTVSNKAYGSAQATSTDGRSWFYDATNFVMRDYNGTTEVFSYLNLAKYRSGHFPIYVHSGGILQGNGVWLGGTTLVYWFKDSTGNANLMRWYTDSTGLPGAPFYSVANNLSEGNAGLIKGNLALDMVNNTSDATKNAAAVSLTNHTIDANSNTLLHIPNAALSNSTIGLTVTSNPASDISVTTTPAALGTNLVVNIPTGGTASRGPISAVNWNFFNGKLDSVRISNDTVYNCVNGTCTVQSVIVNGGGVASVNGTNTSLLFSPTTGNVLGQVNPNYAFTWTNQHTFSGFAPIFSTLTTSGGVFYGNGFGQLLQTGTGTTGQILQSNGGTAPTFFTPNAGIVNGWLGYTALSTSNILVGKGLFKTIAGANVTITPWLDWIFPSDYGNYAGDSITDCTSALQAAANAVTYPGQVIYLGAGVHILTAPITFPKAVHLLGAGGVNNETYTGGNGTGTGHIYLTNNITKFCYNTLTSDGFRIQGKGSILEDFTIQNVDSNATAGNGIYCTAEGLRMNRVGVIRFYNNVTDRVTTVTKISDCELINPTNFNLYLADTVLADAGDNVISDCHFYGGQQGPSHSPQYAQAHVRIESGGGDKFVACKFNIYAHVCLDVYDSLPINQTVDLQVIGGSMENFDQYGFRGQAVAGGSFQDINITGLQISPFNPTANGIFTNASISGVNISGCQMNAHGQGNVGILCQGPATIVGNTVQNWTTNMDQSMSPTFQMNNADNNSYVLNTRVAVPSSLNFGQAQWNNTNADVTGISVFTNKCGSSTGQLAVYGPSWPFVGYLAGAAQLNTTSHLYIGAVTGGSSGYTTIFGDGETANDSRMRVDVTGTAIGKNIDANPNTTLLVKDNTASTGATQLLIQGGATAADATTNKLLQINQGGGTTDIFHVTGAGTPAAPLISTTLIDTTNRKLVVADASGNFSKTSWPVYAQPIKYNHTIFAPTTGGTVNLVNNQYNIINPAGALLAVTLNLPSSPANNDVVYIKFTQTISTVTYANGTVVDGITAPTAGGLVVLTYDSGTTSWY